MRLLLASPSAGDDAGSFLVVSDGDRAHLGSIPERFGIILALIDREVGGVDADAGDVVTVGMELPRHEQECSVTEAASDEVLQVLTPQVLIADLASL